MNGLGAFEEDVSSSGPFGGLPKPKPTGLPILPTAAGLPNPPKLPLEGDDVAPIVNLGGDAPAPNVKPGDAGFSGVANAVGVENAVGAVDPPKRVELDVDAVELPNTLPAAELPLVDDGKLLLLSSLPLS